MNNKLTRFCSLFAICLGVFTASPAKAALLQLVPNWGASGVPTNLSMYIYVPDRLAPNPPILVLLHYWGGGAAGVFAEAQGGGIVAAADQYGFIMIVPQNPDCWDVSSTATLTHNGGGQTQGIAQMVKYTINTYQANSNRVYVTGTSCGGEMTEALLAVYPDIFKAGASFSGQVVGGAWTPITHTAQEWGNIARACYPGYSGPRPRVQLWHGTADGIIDYSNQVEAIMQWGNVLGLSTNPTTTATVIIPGITNQWTHQVWKDASGATRLDAWSEINGPHGTDANLDAQYVIPFLGLDKVGPVDLGAGSQRSRPKLNAAHTTFVADDGQDLRGPYTSTEWTSATSSQNIANMKSLGFNAVHLYAESFDMNYPNAGSTAPGYSVANVDAIVAETRTNGLYLIITIGNGANNGNYNAAYITNFWNFYAPRYASETHVLYEIQNEPVAWGPPYSSASATPPGGLDMEIAAYNAIRAGAPNTPVLLFTYAVFGGTGGASAAMTDIHAFNTAVFGNANQVWTNEAVAFHGYNGWQGTSTAVSSLFASGYPCVMTEYGGGAWGLGVGGLDAEMTSELERLGVSWLGFQYIPPTGVSDDVTKPQVYSNIVVNAGLSWTPDYGSFPPIRGPYGNGGQPRTVPASYVNNFLTGTPLRIQAEDFDTGGEGVAYHELTTTNLGGQYRTNEAVDVETTTDTGGGYDATGTAAGEWMEYTIWVQVAGYYNFSLRYAAPSNGCAVQMTGNGHDRTGTWTLPSTGGSATWATATQPVLLEYGRQKMRLNVLNGGLNLNWMELTPASTGFIPDGTYKFLNGANGLALTALTSTNLVAASNYVGSAYQQWNLLHVGGDQYKITAVPNGYSWNINNNSLITSSGWGTGGNQCFILAPTSGGYYRILPVGNGVSLETSTANSAIIDQKAYAGGANQQWVLAAPSAPMFPVGLSATAISTTQVSLVWNAVTSATSYNVKRSATSGGPYATIALGVTATNYTDTVPVGMTYYYVVSAVASGVESPNSSEAPPNLLYPWMTRDIGAVGVTGGASLSNGMFTVTGAGADIWDTADAFRFIYVPVSGNCTIIARVASVQNVDPWSKAGVMIRSNLDANAVNAFIAVTPGNGVTWQTRSSTGGSTGNSATGSLIAPYWVKLVRSGNTFSGYRSPDGVTWTQQGTSQTFTMATTAYVGLALTSHNSSTPCTATFDNVTAPGWSNPIRPNAPASLTAIVTNWNVALTWQASSGAISYNVKRATTYGGPYTAIANVTTTNYTDNTMANNTSYYYVVSALNAAGEGAYSIQATVSGQTFAPSGLFGTVISTTRINLTWNTFTNATNYNVKRSAFSGGPYASIATGVTGTNYTDTSVSPGSGWYYVVSATVGVTETPNSAEAVLQYSKLTGAIVGTSGSYNNSGNTITNVFDNNLTTFFDGPNTSYGNGCWAGLDFGAGVRAPAVNRAWWEAFSRARTRRTSATRSRSTLWRRSRQRACSRR